MRTFLLILLAGFLSLSSKAQWSYRYLSKEKHFIYSSGDYIVGKNNSGKISVNYVYNNKYTVNIGYSATSKHDAALSQDILKSTTELSSENSATPFANTENIHLMFGRVFKLNRDGTIRFLLQGGPGIFTSRNPEYEINSTTYNFSTETQKSLGLIFQPKFEMPVLYSIGFSAGPMLMVSNNETYVGAGIGLMYGITGR